MQPKIYGKKLTPSKKIAYSAVMCALLIAGQFAFSFVSGVEVVTLLLLSFAFCFGVQCGMFTAVAFSLLRCFIWGFYPAVIVLYLIYYPILALIFGLLGKISDDVYTNAPAWLFAVVNVILLAVAAACFSLAVFDVISISRLYKRTIKILLWVIFGLCIALAIAFDITFFLVKAGKIKSENALKVFLVTTLAAVCTICFTLLDDVISPLFLGMDINSALAYFYASFLAMLPQTICTIVSVSLLFLPLTKVFNRLIKGKIKPE
jgi:hypothetical protein